MYIGFTIVPKFFVLYRFYSSFTLPIHVKEAFLHSLLPMTGYVRSTAGSYGS